MIDWSLARQVARFAAGSAPRLGLGVDLQPMATLAVERVRGYTGLVPATAAPAPEVVDRDEWVQANLQTLASMLDPVAERLTGRLSVAGPLSGPLRLAAGATLAAEVGLVMGYLSQRVLGQYEISLLQPASPQRLLFVEPNLESAAHSMKVQRSAFLQWVVLHEVTHALQFAGVPWLREHLASLLEEYLETVEVQIKRGAAGGLPTLPSPAKLVESFREGGLAALVQTRQQRRVMARMQAAMSVIEGYAEHVMDAAAPDVVADHSELRDAMARRRSSRSAPERILERLLGLDLKLRQYELGKRWCDEVVELAGIGGLNRVWDSPEALPDLSELRRPADWLARVAGGSAAAA